MRIDTMRALDSGLGPLFCRILLALRVVFPSAGEPAFPKAEPRTILVMKFFGMGSILLASPSLIELKKKYPASRIVLLTLESHRELCEMLPWVDEIVGLKISRFGVFLKSLSGAVRSVREQSPDMILNLEFLTNFSAFVALLVTVFKPRSTVVGFISPYRWRNSINDINVCFDHSRHVMKTFAKVVSSVTGTAFEPRLEMIRPALEERTDPNVLQKYVAGNKKLAGCTSFICVNINAGELCPQRRWPVESFSAVVRGILEDAQGRGYFDRDKAGSGICG